MSKEIHVITVATHRTPAFLNFYSSLIRTNYNENNIHILGQDQKFQGWKWRTEQYLNKIKEINDPNALYVFCDSSDLFFIAGPTLLQKHYEEYKTPVVLSNYSWYGQINRLNEKEKLDEICVTSPFCYANGGFLIGTLNELIEYFTLNSEYEDDENGAAHILTSGNNNSIVIDFNLSLVATIFQAPIIGVIDLWEFSEKDKTFISRITGRNPIALHFPGPYYNIPYNEYLPLFYPDLPLIPKYSGRIFKILCFIFFIILFLFLILFFSKINKLLFNVG